MKVYTQWDDTQRAQSHNKLATGDRVNELKFQPKMKINGPIAIVLNLAVGGSSWIAKIV